MSPRVWLSVLAAVVLTNYLFAQNETRFAPVRVPTPGAESSSAHTTWNSRLVRTSDGTIITAFFNRPSGTVHSGSRTAFGRSTDDGSTFVTAALEVPEPEFTGVQDLAYGLRDDVTYLLGSSTGTVPRKMALYVSRDAGRTFEFLINVPNPLGPDAVVEEGVLAVNNVPGSPYYGRVFVVAYDFAAGTGILFRSADDPFRFLAVPFTTPAGTARLAGLCVDRNGDLLLVTLGTANDLYFFRSTDGGETLSAPVALGAKVTATVDGTLATPFLAQGTPRIAVNPATGTLFVVYAGRGTAAQDPADCYVQSSTDGGATWAAPFELSELGQLRPQWAPEISFNETGTGIVTWNDSDWGERATTFRRCAFLLTEPAAGAFTYGNTFPLTRNDSPIIWDSEANITGPGYAAARITDREGQVAVPGGFLCTFAQTDARVPGVEREYQADLYSVFVPLSGSGPQVEAVSLDVSGAPDQVGPDGCFQLTPRLRNTGEANVVVSYTAEILSPRSGVSFVRSTGLATVFAYRTAQKVPTLLLQTTQEFDCAAGPLVIRLTMTTAEGAVFADDLPVSLWRNETVAHAFSNAAAVAIPDASEGVSHGVAEVPIEVSGLTDNDVIGNVSLALTLPHTYVSDLVVELVDNHGDTWLLANRNGSPNLGFGVGCPSEGSTATVFLDAADVTPIERDRPPFIGAWRPVGNLAGLAGRLGSSYNGQWRLRATDRGAVDTGTIECATLQFHARDCAPPAHAGSECGPSLEFVSTTRIVGTQPQGSDFIPGPGECHAHVLTLRNRGPVTLTNLSGRIVPAPDANITTGNELVRFASIRPGAVGNSETGFTFSVSSNLGVCPSTNEFTFIGTSDQGPVEAVGRILVTGATVGGGQINSTALLIPTNGNPLEIPFNISFLVSPVALVEMQVYIEHTAIGDLDLTLIDPQGTQVQLLAPSSDKRDDLGHSGTGPAIFAEAATHLITDPREDAPFTGYYKPAQSLATFNGTTAAFANGTWKLRIRDQGGNGTGRFREGTLFVYGGECETDPSFACENKVTLAGVRLEPGSDDDRVLEPGECVGLRVGLRNDGLLGQTNIRLQLAPGTGVESVPAGDLTFPLILPGAVGWSSNVVRLQSAQNLACGADALALDGTLVSDQLTAAGFGFNLPLGFGPQTNGTTASSAAPVAVPDFPSAGIKSDIIVSGFEGFVGDVRVAVKASHPFVGDLEMTLVSPAGVRSRLISSYGSGRDAFGNDCPAGENDLVFSLHATQTYPALPASTMPVTGTGTGLDGLFMFAGLTAAEVNGIWSLEVRDLSAQDSGTLECWSLSLLPAICNGSAGPPCSAPNPDAWFVF